MKTVIQEQKILEVDLSKLPYIQWPQRAKDIALIILMNHRHRKTMDSQLSELRRGWLIAKIEELDSIGIIDEL